LVGAPVVRTDVRTVGLTARGGRRMAFKMTTGENRREREREIERGTSEWASACERETVERSAPLRERMKRYLQ